eukprot:gene16962-17149_t
MTVKIRLDRMLFERRMSLSELADRVGVTTANLSILKTGRARAIRFSTLDALCVALDCQPGDLLEFVPGRLDDLNDFEVEATSLNPGGAGGGPDRGTATGRSVGVAAAPVFCGRRGAALNGAVTEQPLNRTAAETPIHSHVEWRRNVPVASGLDIERGSPLGSFTSQQDAAAQASGWTADETRPSIRRTFEFKDFSEAFGFMSRVALAAETADHHPEWSNMSLWRTG